MTSLTIPILSEEGYRQLLEMSETDPDSFLLAEPCKLKEALDADAWISKGLPLARSLDSLNDVTGKGPSTDYASARTLRAALALVPYRLVNEPRLWASLNCFVLALYTGHRWEWSYNPRGKWSEKESKTEFVKRHWLKLGSAARESNASARLWWLYEIAERASAFSEHDPDTFLRLMADNVGLYHQMLRRPNLIGNMQFTAALLELALEEIPELRSLKSANKLLQQLNTQAGSSLFDVKDKGQMAAWIRDTFHPKAHRGSSPRSHIPAALRVLSLGGGVQSTVMCLLAAQGAFRCQRSGEVCLPDYALFADTDWEPQGVYDTIDWLRTQVPFPILTVSNKRSLRQDVKDGVNARGRKWLTIPVYLAHKRDGTAAGRNWRQCTTDYKIVPIQRKVRALLGLAARRAVAQETKVEMWLGITTDEFTRLKASQDPWIENRYPLIEEKPMSRDDCVAWFGEHYPGRTLIRSACVGCPFRSGSSWIQVRENDPERFAEAVAIDRSLRQPHHPAARTFRHTVYLHSRRLPLAEAVAQDAEDLLLSGEFHSECSGHCGV